MKKKIYLLSFCFPIVFVLASWLLVGIYPLGKYTLLTNDFLFQFIDLYYFYRNSIASLDFGSFFYSFSKSIGGGMIGVWAFGLMSPLNLVLLFFSYENVVNVINFVILLRFGLMGLTMSHYLIGKLNDKIKYIPIFSTMYALSGMIVAYQIHPVFFDIMIVTPLLILYLERWLDGTKNYKYILVLIYIWFFHFYFGYIISLFVVFYTLYYVFSKKSFKEIAAWKNIFVLGFYSFFTVSTLSWFLIPVYNMMLLSRGASSKGLQFSPFFSINPLDILSRFMLGAVQHGITPNTMLPFVYIGSVFIVFTLLYWSPLNKVDKREKIATAILLGFLIFAMSNTMLNMIWHMGQMPNGTYVRFSWLFSFLLITISYKTISNFDYEQFYVTKKSFLIIFGIFLSVYIYLFLNNESYNFFSEKNIIEIEQNIMTIVSYVIIALLLVIILYGFSNTIKYKLSTAIFCFVCIFYYLDLMKLHQTATILIWVLVLVVLSSKKYKEILLTIVFLVTSSEILINTYITYKKNIYERVVIHIDKKTSIKEVIDTIKNNDKFARISTDLNFNYNNPLAQGYYGLTHYTSNQDIYTSQLFSKIGLSGNKVSTRDLQSNDISDSFLGAKYFITSNEQHLYKYKKFDDIHKFINEYDRNVSENYTIYKELDRFKIYENKNALPLAFVVDYKLVIAKLFNTSVYENQNMLLNLLGANDKEVLKNIPLEFSYTNYEPYTGSRGESKLRKIKKGEEARITFTVPFSQKNNFYLSIPVSIMNETKDYKIFVNDKEIKKPYGSEYDGIINVIFKEKNKNLKYEIILKGDKDIDISHLKLLELDTKVVTNVFSNIQNKGLNIQEISSNFLEGDINLTEDNKYLLFTLPYDDSWNIKIDDKEVQPIKAIESLIAVPITSGYHKITMVYIPKGLYTGIVISIVSIIILISLFRKKV